MNPDWLIPDWPALPGVRALCSTRAGGLSTGPFASFNLGDHVGDDAAAVQANRERLRRAIGAVPVFLRQVHGTQVLALDSAEAARAPAVPADACLTRQSGLACTIMVADCLPLLLATRCGSVVAAAHAGWRGLAGPAGVGADGVIEATFKAFSALARTHCAQFATKLIADQTQVWLGPCIGAPAFEVGDEVRQAFMAHDARAASCFVPLLQPGSTAGAVGADVAPKWLADLSALARQRLQALGITQVYGNDGSRHWCTASNPSRFFSHRRDRISGRFAVCIWRE